MSERPKFISALDAVEKAQAANDTAKLSEYGSRGAEITNAKKAAALKEMVDAALARGDQHLPEDDLPKDLRKHLAPYREDV